MVMVLNLPGNTLQIQYRCYIICAMRISFSLGFILKPKPHLNKRSAETETLYTLLYLLSRGRNQTSNSLSTWVLSLTLEYNCDCNMKGGIDAWNRWAEAGKETAVRIHQCTKKLTKIQKKRRHFYDVLTNLHRVLEYDNVQFQVNAIQ